MHDFPYPTQYEDPFAKKGFLHATRRLLRLVGSPSSSWGPWNAAGTPASSQVCAMRHVSASEGGGAQFASRGVPFLPIPFLGPPASPSLPSRLLQLRTAWAGQEGNVLPTAERLCLEKM